MLARPARRPVRGRALPRAPASTTRPGSSASGADGEDLYPRLREVMADAPAAAGPAAAADRGEHSDAARGASVYEGAPGRARPDRAHGRLRLLPHRVEPPRLGVRPLLPQEPRRWSSEFIPPALGLLRDLRRPRRGGRDRPSCWRSLKQRAEAVGRVRRADRQRHARPASRPSSTATSPNRGLIDNLPAGLLRRGSLPGRRQRRPADRGRRRCRRSARR